MTARIAIVAVFSVIAAALAWILFVGLPQRYAPPAEQAAAPPPAPAESDGRKIKVQLFYVGEDGRSLAGVEQEVAFAEEALEQARAIVAAQLAPAAPPLVSAIPSGTALRAVFVAGSEAYVDLSPEIMAAHPGGSTNELLTVYTLVHALTANLPAVSTVQLMVDGREIDTLAGHVNLRRPLGANPDWMP